MPPLDKLARRVQSGDFPAPRTVAPSVPRALEAVCLKAMALRPADRYGSAQELASDIEGWLADEAVTALPDSLAERCGRWARRHRTLVAAMLGLLLTAVIALAIGTVLLNLERERTVEERNQADASDRRAQEQQHKAEQNEATAIAEANRATEQARRAAQKAAEVEQISNFLVNLFRTADPLSLRGSGFGNGIRAETNLTAKEMLQRGRQRIEDLKEQPLVQAKLLENLGDVYRDLGDYNSSKELLDRAWELRRRLLPPDDPAIAETALSLGRWHQDQGHFQDAKEFYNQALSIRRKHDSDDSLAVAEVLFQQAWLLSDGNQERLAEPLFRQVIRVRENLLGTTHADTQVAKVFLVMILFQQRREMEAMLVLGSDLPLTEIPRGILQYRTADSLQTQGRFDEARVEFESLLQRVTETLGQRHPLRAMLLGTLAGLAQRQGRIAEARALAEEAMPILEPLLRNHSRMAHPAAQYAMGMHFLGHLELAERYFRHSYRLARVGLDQEAGLMLAETHTSVVGLARTLLDQGRYEELPQLFEDGHAFAVAAKVPQFQADCLRFRAQQFLAQGDPTSATPLLEQRFDLTQHLSDLLALVECLHETGQDSAAVEQAEVALQRAEQLAAQLARQGGNHPALTHLMLAQVFFLHGHIEFAENQYREAVRSEALGRPIGHPGLSGLRVTLARFLTQIGQFDEAVELLERAEKDFRENVGARELPTTEARRELAQVHHRRGDDDAAIELARSVLSDRLQILGIDHPAVSEAQLTLAECLPRSQEVRRAEAAALLETAHLAIRKRFGPGHPRLFEVVEQRADFLRATGGLDQALRLLDSTSHESPQSLPRSTSTSTALLDSVRGAIAVDHRDYLAAESLLTASHQRLLLTFGRLDDRTQRSLRRLVRLYESWEKPETATEYRRLLPP